MSQHDFDFATADGNTGVTVRAGMNAMAQALATCSSGATEPSTMYAYQFWADTTSGYMKQRNAANNAWLTRWQLSVGQLAALAGATYTGLVNEAAGADIASATTIDLTAATGNSPRITGTTPTSAVTMNTGQKMAVVADGAWPLTYHATTNKLNTGADYTCKAGDVIFYHKDNSGVVHGEISRPTGIAAGNVMQADVAITTVASATTTALAGTREQLITGTTPITGFTGTTGTKYHCRTDGALPLTHHATNLIIMQTGASVTLDAGATFDVYMITASTARITNIQLASGAALTSSSGITLGTPVASTSGTAIDFTSIPATAKRVTIMLKEVSVSGTSRLLFQIGDSGGIETTGYSSRASNAGGSTVTTSSTSFCTAAGPSAASTASGALTLTKENTAAFSWVGVLSLASSDSSLSFGTGSKSLSAALDRVRITTENGSDTFDAGEINISWEV